MKIRKLKYWILIIGLWSCNQLENSADEINVSFAELTNNTVKKDKNIPDELIERIKEFNGGDSLANLINRQVFEIMEDSIFETDQYFGVMNPMFVDLDSDNELELVCLFGVIKEAANLGVFDMKSGKWKCVFFGEFGHHYEGVNFMIANNPAKEKVIIIKNLEGRGSGIYKEATHFFKLINGEIKHCLRLISDSRIHGWGLYMNQEVKTEYQFSSYTNDDKIWVAHSYSYFPGPIFKNDVSWNSHPDISLISETEGMNYEWNSAEMIYEPQYKNEKRNYGMTKLQLQAIDEFGNDTLIVSAFKEEFEEIRTGEDEEKKKIVSKYLEMVENDKKANVPSGEVEKFGETEGGLEYYGVKKKEEK